MGLLGAIGFGHNARHCDFYVDWRDVQFFYIEILTEHPRMSSERAFELAYQMARQQRLAYLNNEKEITNNGNK